MSFSLNFSRKTGIKSDVPVARTLSTRFPPLLLQAERIANTVYQGVHGRRRAGMGESFWQFRPYAAGDPAERIDWRQSARTTKYYVREREYEAAQTGCVWVDPSGSMDYASDARLPTKRDRADVLMLALASLMLRGGEKIMWLDGAEPLTVFGNNGLRRIVDLLESKSGTPDAKDGKPRLLCFYPVPRHAAVILCSDFLMPDADFDQIALTYAQSGQGALVHILDPIEQSFAFDGRVEMRGCENEDLLLLPNAAALRDAYMARLTAHRERLQKLAAHLGWAYVRHVTHDDPQLALSNIYQALAANSQR